VTVSKRDRELTGRIATYKDASHAEAEREHLAAREDEPSPFYARARALEMIRD